MSVYGPIVTGLHVQQAVENTLRVWAPAYIGEVAAQLGKARSDLPDFRSYTKAAEMDKWPEDQLPACIVVCPGLADGPARHGHIFRAAWAVSVYVVASGRDEQSTQELVQLYVGAVRSALMQHPSLGDFAVGVEWLDESYDDSATINRRTMASGQVILSVEVDDVLDSSQGLLTPPVDPDADPGEWPQVETTSITSQGATV